MVNPFELILEKLESLEARFSESNSPPLVPSEIIASEELCSRLKISEPTLIAWRRKNKIPFIKLDGVIRYNWPKVVEALEAGTKKVR